MPNILVNSDMNREVKLRAIWYWSLSSCLYVYLTRCLIFFRFLSFTDDAFLSLTPNSINFCQSGMTFLEDLLKLSQPSVQYLVDRGVSQMWSLQIQHIEQSLTSVQYIQDVSVCTIDGAYSTSSVLSVSVLDKSESTLKFYGRIY